MPEHRREISKAQPVELSLPTSTPTRPNMLGYPFPQETLVANPDYKLGLGREVLPTPTREFSSLEA